MIMILIELFMALVVWKRKWKELALVPFIVVMAAHLGLGHLNTLTNGGIANFTSGYMLVIHMLAIFSLGLMTFYCPQRISIYKKNP